MTFEAYINNIRAKTGKTPKDFWDEAHRRGILRPDTKPMEFVAWLKGSSGLGHGHDRHPGRPRKLAAAHPEAASASAWVTHPGAHALASGCVRAGGSSQNRDLCIQHEQVSRSQGFAEAAPTGARQSA